METRETNTRTRQLETQKQYRNDRDKHQKYTTRTPRQNKTPHQKRLKKNNETNTRTNKN